MPAVALEPRTYTIPKPGGGVRLMTELGSADAAEWLRLAAAVCRPAEAALGPEVLANRWRRRHARLAPFRPALRRARAAARRLGAGAEALVRTDVRAFYPSVGPGQLDRSLARLLPERQVRTAAAGLLERWEDAGIPGLPVGPEPSALFANVVLAPVDAALRRSGVRFVRWVDDYLLEPGRRDASDALAILDGALDRAGLERHTGKTRVVAARGITWPGPGYGG